MIVFSEREIVAGLRTGQDVGAIMRFLYARNFLSIKKLVSKKGGNTQDAEDLFQDTIIIFIEIVAKDQFDPEGEATVHTYLYKIAYNLWVKRWRRDNQKEYWEREFAATYQKIEEVVRKYEDRLTADQILSRLGEPCRTILTSYYIDGLSLEEIAVKIERSEGAVKQQKFRCINLLKELYERR